MLKPSDIKTLRRLLDKAGSETEFQRAVKRAQQLPKRDRGRPERNDGLGLLLYLETVCRIFERVGIKRNTTLKMLVYPRQDNLYGKTPQAAVHRLARRLRSKEFKKQFTDENLHTVIKETEGVSWGGQFDLASGLSILKRLLDKPRVISARERERAKRDFKESFAKVIQNGRR